MSFKEYSEYYVFIFILEEVDYLFDFSTCWGLVIFEKAKLIKKC